MVSEGGSTYQTFALGMSPSNLQTFQNLPLGISGSGQPLMSGAYMTGESMSNHMLLSGYNSVNPSPRMAARAQDSLQRTFFESMGARDMTM